MTTGLLDKAESENELAFVLSHELGHHQLRHPSRGLGRSLPLGGDLCLFWGWGNKVPPLLTRVLH